MIFSVTEVQSFKRCRRQWDYGSFNRQGITPIIQPKPYLDLGTLIHKTLAYWTQKPHNADGSPIELRTVFMALSIQHRYETIRRYTEATGHPPTEAELEPLTEAITLGAAMAENYQTYYGEPLPAHLTFCQAEQEIIVPIPGTEHFLKARLDALAQDKAGNIYVIERKTYDKRPDLTLLEASDQFIGYVWVAQQLQLGPVAGIAYDGLFKRAAPSSRSVAKTMDDLFIRTVITPQQDEVNEYGLELARTVQDMANDPYIYKNRQWQGCWDCSFEQLCRAQSQQLDIEYILRMQYTRRTEDDTADIVAAVDSHTIRTGA